MARGTKPRHAACPVAAEQSHIRTCPLRRDNLCVRSRLWRLSTLDLFSEFVPVSSCENRGEQVDQLHQLLAGLSFHIQAISLYHAL